ncbi:MAG TPA: glutathione S-transferase N-terminal domain-containing protein [Acetobacteraceae bacterium]|jgi:glutathione S-transferase|nr:glutathione S-transferase N-terminal domain-containing protein [Acetobacteraceae bacterium]
MDGTPNDNQNRAYPSRQTVQPDGTTAEKGLEIDPVPVDLGAKEQFSEAYRAINPRMVVPTLVLDDGTAIGEVPAIMRYFDDADPEVPLLGSTPQEKAIIAMWERRTELEGFAAVRAE